MLTYDDLIKTIKIINNEGKEVNILLFLVISHVNQASIHHYHRWVMGRPFVKKYQFFFEENSKMIFFYKKENIIYDNNKNWINNTFFIFNYRIFIIVLLIFFILFYFFIFYKSLKIKKAKQNIKEKNKNDKFEMHDYKELIDKD